MQRADYKVPKNSSPKFQKLNMLNSVFLPNIPLYNVSHKYEADIDPTF